MVEDAKRAAENVACGYYTPKEVATILNLSIDMVYDLLREGRLPSIRLGAGKRQMWRIPKEEFEIYIKNARSGPSFVDEEQGGAQLPGYDVNKREELKAKLETMQKKPSEKTTSTEEKPEDCKV
jgi:excisionase family DNA binding protein